MLKKLFLSNLVILFILLSIALYRTAIHTASVKGTTAGEVISIDEAIKMI